jgi:transposase
MMPRLHLTRPLVKDLTGHWRAALANGQFQLVRRLTALLMVGHGLPIPTVAADLQLGESTLHGWVHDFLLRGPASLLYRHSSGRPPKLNGEQKQRLRALLVAGPEAAGYDTGAWNTPLVQDLIYQQWGVEFNIHYLSALLGGLGFSYQKGRFVSDHLDEAKRQTWFTQTWPAIVAEALRTDALLLFGDEASFAQWGSLGYTWAPRGQQPLVKTTGRRKGYKVWGLLEWFSGRLFWSGQEGRLNAKGYIGFLEGVLGQTKQRLMIVQDGARYHTAAEVQEWVTAHAARVSVYQLPSYSPDYNPIEHVWRYVKEGTHCAYFASFAALVARVEERLGRLGGDVGRVQQLMGTLLDDLIGTELPAAA